MSQEEEEEERQMIDRIFLGAQTYLRTPFKPPKRWMNSLQHLFGVCIRVIFE